MTVINGYACMCSTTEGAVPFTTWMPGTHSSDRPVWMHKNLYAAVMWCCGSSATGSQQMGDGCCATDVGHQVAPLHELTS